MEMEVKGLKESEMMAFPIKVSSGSNRTMHVTVTACRGSSQMRSQQGEVGVNTGAHI